MSTLEVKDNDGSWHYWMFHDSRLAKSTLAVLACDNSNFKWRIRDQDGLQTGEIA